MWKSFRHKLQTARQLSLGEWLGLVQAWWALLGFYLALRVVNFDRLEAFARPAVKVGAVPTEALAWVWGRERLVCMAARLHVVSMTCLPRALALCWLAGRRAISAQLCIGMNKTSTGMLAHAWVEIDGQAIGESEDISERFKVLRTV